MTIPTASNFPEDFDNDNNLFLVHDALRVQLAEDYIPGNKSIVILGDNTNFPNTGIITLTEQNSDIDERAISFYYGSKTETTFDELEILSEFEDVYKPKNITNITLNVVSAHHNNIKDSIIAIERFLGVKGDIASSADRSLLLSLDGANETIEGRLNYLKKLVLTPRAWFSANKNIGLIPLEVEFTDLSFRLGKGEVQYIWDFGDQDDISNASTISVTSEVPLGQDNVIVYDLDGGKIKKTYSKPGKFDVKLTVINENGQDTVEFKDLINARVQSPSEAIINFIPRSGIQILTPGDPIGGPFITVPKLKSPVNTLIDMEIEDNGENNDDPIISYVWSLNDDLQHGTSDATKALYSIGGIYDLKVRANTLAGAYRITVYENAINILERRNLWLWNYTTGNNVLVHEFGLINETFKTGEVSLNINNDNSFLDGTNNEEQAKFEFRRNNGFATRGTTPSGNRGTALLFWASGGEPIETQEVVIKEFEAFAETYSNIDSIPNHPWNWAFLASSTKAYFVFGQEPNPSFGDNFSYQVKDSINLVNLSVSTPATLTLDNYENGAQELKYHVSEDTDNDGIPDNGYFATYRTAWKDQTGYILRNDAVGTFYKLRSFYRTEGTVSQEFQLIRKLTDMAGPAKVEGQLVPLVNGVFFFNNSGSISAYNDTTNVWEVGGPSTTSASFKSLQDTNISGFDEESNTLLAASDLDRIVYLSYDYSENAFIKFNGVDTTFTSIGSRPAGDQWMMNIF